MALAVVGALGLAAGCAPASVSEVADDEQLSSPPPLAGTPDQPSDLPARGTVTLAFAGDMHFQLHLEALLDRPRGALGPIAQTLRSADVAMVNLETAITERGTPEAKELENPGERYYFRTAPAALDVLAAAGIDVATMANNHGADYGPAGLRDSLKVIRAGPTRVIGIGRNRQAAFTPHLVTVRGTRIAFLAGDASPREGASNVWEAGRTTPGIAAAHHARPKALLAAVRAAGRQADVVVVYMHWGEELQGCPTTQQLVTAQALADAGADVVVGSHAHVLLGSGWLGDSYVNYGLGNFLWYHNSQPETGVLTVEIADGRVVADSWEPARIGTWGQPRPLNGAQRRQAITDWRGQQSCAGLAASPSTDPPASYGATISRIGPGLRGRLSASHRPGCPVSLGDLRYLRLPYVGYDGKSHLGEMVVHQRHSRAVVHVFRRLYLARWPIRRMRIVDEYGGDDNRSMAANNTSAYNCRRVAGSQGWSDHAFGTAIDINPVQNPYLTGAGLQPKAGRGFAGLDRSKADLPRGVIGDDSVVVKAFADIGWRWGGRWASPDYQHFYSAAQPEDLHGSS